MKDTCWKILIKRFHNRKWNLLAEFAPREMRDDSVEVCLRALNTSYSKDVQFLATDREDWDRHFNLQGHHE